jgi:D-alanyl-D-alanine dipeptidase
MSRLIYEDIPIIENHEPLVDVSTYPFVIDPVYYRLGYSADPVVRLRKGVAGKLLQIQEGFGGKYRFKIWDGYRPRSVQDAIYSAYQAEVTAAHPDWTHEDIIVQVETFVTKASDRQRIPPHATGGTIDLTLVEAEGNELDMGTEFDSFNPEAASMYFEDNVLDERIRNNRRILREAMAKADFRVDDDEWWHFDYGNQIWATVLGRPHAFYGESLL